MKRFVTFILAIFLLLTSSITTICAEDIVPIATNPSIDGFYITDAGGTTITQYDFSSFSDPLNFEVGVDNSLTINSTLTLTPIGTTSFTRWEYRNGSGVDVAIEDGNSENKVDVKIITALFDNPPCKIIFNKNKDGISYTTNVADITSVPETTDVTFTVNYDSNTIQLDYIDIEGISDIDVTKNGTTLSFIMPPSNDITITARGGTIIKDANILLVIPADGDTSLATPSITGSGYYVDIDNMALLDIATSDIVDASNPVVEGNQYLICMSLIANTGYSFKNTSGLKYIDGADDDNIYKYDVNVKINGESIIPYASSVESGTRSGYDGTDSNKHDRINIYYIYTAPAKRTPTPGGGSSSSHKHHILNTGVK